MIERHFTWNLKTPIIEILIKQNTRTQLKPKQCTKSYVYAASVVQLVRTSSIMRVVISSSPD